MRPIMVWQDKPRSQRSGLAIFSAGSSTGDTDPAIVFVHGVGLRAEAWAAQIADLANHYAAIAVDIPGHGQSPLPLDRMTLREYGDAIVRLIDRPAILVGHSLGALIALDVASRYPEDVCGVAALNTIFRRSNTARQAVQQRADRLDGKTAADPSETLNRWFGVDGSAEREACAHWLKSVDPNGYRAAYRIFAEEDGIDDEGLAALSCPALFMTGGKDPNSTPAMSRSMAERAPHGRVRVIKSAAHMMPMTHAEPVNEELLAFAAGCRS
jgi:pimeloyl-ACP methyl ester carboxylesterase